MKPLSRYKIVLTLLSIGLYLSNLSAQCPSGHNTFIGSTDSYWSTASNWTQGCVPVSPITGFISIENTCYLDVSATFNTGSTLQIKAGTSLINFGSSLTMNGTMRGSGTYFGSATLGGAIKPGYMTPPVVAATTGSVTHGGQTYATKLMPDGRWWMTENLNIGTMINGSNNMANNSVIEKYCYNNDAANCTTYGGLYQWDEMMQYTTTEGTRGVCPVGWHLPTNAEWTALEAAQPSPDKGSRLAGNAALWVDGALEQSIYFGTSGFAALPAGRRRTDGSFGNQGNNAFIWSSTQTGASFANFRFLYYDTTDVGPSSHSKAYGFSVRCLQD
jgi:uncharacterized protein (TIGR02145 family)